MSRLSALELGRSPAIEYEQRRLSAAWRAELLRAGVALLAVVATLLLRLPELDRYATIDESRWVGRSADFASYIAERDLDKTFIVGHPGVTTMWLGSLGLGAERVRAFSYLEGQTDVTRRDGYLEALVAARRATTAANALMLGGMLWLAWGLFGPGPVLLGGLLLLLDPFYAAHARLIHLDALLASFMALAALTSLAFWSGRSWGYAVAAGLFSGLALLTKAPSIYLLAFIPALALFEHIRLGRWRGWPGWLRLVGGLALWSALAWTTCLALWPAFRLKPLAVLRQMADFTLKNGGGERDNFFLGMQLEDPGPLFYPLALLFRATPLLLLGLALLLWALLRRHRHLPQLWPALLLGGYAIGFLLLMTLGQKKFDRYELPIYPALNLLAGLGLWLAWNHLRRTLPLSRWRLRRALPLSLVLVLALAAWPLASVFPYYLSYYNPLLGGGATAQRLLFVGWGEGLDRVAAYVNEKPIVLQAPTVATAYHRALQAHLNGNNAMPLDRAELADYIVPYVNSMQRNQDTETLAPLLAGQEPEHVVWINGIEYARIYRGPHFPIERTVGADFGGQVRLESTVVAPGSGRARAGDEVLVRLRWRAAGDAAALTSGLRVVAPGGAVVVQDRQPLGRALREGPLLIVDAQLRLPGNLAPGGYRVEALVEDTGGNSVNVASGERAVTVQTLAVQAAR